MKYQLPPLAGLRAFEVAARYENFARAAEELNLAQATVSHRVRMLEKHLGYTLFERLPRGLRLTESGKAYLPSVQKSFEQIFSSTVGIFGHRGEGVLTVRAPVSYSSLWLSPMIDDFLTRYPGIELRLVSSVWAEDVVDREIDIDFRLGYGHWNHCRAELVMRETVVPVCRPELLQRLDGKLDGADRLARFSLIHVMGIEDLWMNYLGESGVDFAARRQDVHVDSVVSALQIVQHSDRFALLQSHFVEPCLERGELCVAFDRSMQIEQAIYLVQPLDDRAAKPEAILFREWLTQRLG